MVNNNSNNNKVSTFGPKMNPNTTEAVMVLSTHMEGAWNC